MSARILQPATQAWCSAKLSNLLTLPINSYNGQANCIIQITSRHCTDYMYLSHSILFARMQAPPATFPLSYANISDRLTWIFHSLALSMPFKPCICITGTSCCTRHAGKPSEATFVLLNKHMRISALCTTSWVSNSLVTSHSACTVFTRWIAGLHNHSARVQHLLCNAESKTWTTITDALSIICAEA